MTPPQVPPPAQLLQHLSGYMVTQAIAVLAELDVAERLAGGPRPVVDLATELAVDADALYRFLRAAASVGVFTEVAPKTFGLTPTASLLREDSKPSLRHIAILFGGTLYQAWGQAKRSMKTGQPVFAEVFGEPHFDYLGKHPEALATFSKAMAGAARGRLEMLDAVDWSRSKRIVDVGGGDGTLVGGLLAKHPHLEQGTVFDLPELEPAAKERLAAMGVSGRGGFAGGSFLTTAPPPADTYVFAKVLHNWSDEDCLKILGHCRRVAQPGARVVVVDDILKEGNEVQQAKLLDLQMLIILGGRERTEKEFGELLGRAGFRLTRAMHDPRGGIVLAELV